MVLVVRAAITARTNLPAVIDHSGSITQLRVEDGFVVALDSGRLHAGICTQSYDC